MNKALIILVSAAYLTLYGLMAYGLLVAPMETTEYSGNATAIAYDEEREEIISLFFD